MENHWIERNRKRQIAEVEASLHSYFDNLTVMVRPYTNGLKLFIKQAGLHVGNIVYVRNMWEIQYYTIDGGYDQQILPRYGTMDFWKAVKMKFGPSIARGVVVKA
jgi:hypothetical protein